MFVFTSLLFIFSMDTFHLIVTFLVWTFCCRLKEFSDRIRFINSTLESLLQRREEAPLCAPLNLSTKDSTSPTSPTSPESPASSSPIFDFKTETILKHESNQSPSPRLWTKEEDRKR